MSPRRNLIPPRAFLQPQYSERLRRVESPFMGRPPRQVLLALAHRKKEISAQLSALGRRDCRQRTPRNHHLGVPEMQFLIDARLHLKSRVPGPSGLARVPPVNIQIDPLAVRRNLKLAIAVDVLKIRPEKRLRHIPLP